MKIFAVLDFSTPGQLWSWQHAPVPLDDLREAMRALRAIGVDAVMCPSFQDTPTYIRASLASGMGIIPMASRCVCNGEYVVDGGADARRWLVLDGIAADLVGLWISDDRRKDSAAAAHLRDKLAAWKLPLYECHPARDGMFDAFGARALPHPTRRFWQWYPWRADSQLYQGFLDTIGMIGKMDRELDSLCIQGYGPVGEVAAPPAGAMLFTLRMLEWWGAQEVMIFTAIHAPGKAGANGLFDSKALMEGKFVYTPWAEEIAKFRGM